jgi:hypothetical protein
LAIEVDEALPFRRPEMNALGAGHGNGVDLGLGRPLEEGVLFGEVDDFLAGETGIYRGRGHVFLAFDSFTTEP